MSLAHTNIRRPVRVPVELPVPWLERAAQLPGKGLHVGVALLYMAAIRRSAQVQFSQGTLQRRFHTSRDASYDALQRMSVAGLVRVTPSIGRSHLVTLLDTNGQAMVMP